MAAIEEDDALVVRGSKRLHDLLEHRQCRPRYRPMDTAAARCLRPAPDPAGTAPAAKPS